ncbi:hypothetical protein HDU84_003102 [Entophlyctis sp. JEL0112]|nr:hypothetical protein HDU84_003102 [Entophlyctis sp. JEL0112]
MSSFPVEATDMLRSTSIGFIAVAFVVLCGFVGFVLVCERSSKILTPFNVALFLMAVANIGAFSSSAATYDPKLSYLQQKAISMFGQFSASTFQVAYIFTVGNLMNLLYTIAPVVYFLEVVPHFILIAQGFRGGSDSNSDELVNMLLVTADGLGTLFTCAFDTVLVIAFLRVLQGREFGIDTMVLRASAASESQRCERQAVSTSRMSGFSKKRFVVVAKYGIASVVCAAVLMTLFMIASFQSDAVVFVSLTATVDLLMVTYFAILFAMKIALWREKQQNLKEKEETGELSLPSKMKGKVKLFQIQIAQLKDRVQSAQGFPAVQQKLIYAGKILADDATVESSGITEAGFIVVMVTKPKAASTSTAATAPVSQISSSVPEPVPAVSAPDAPSLEAEIATGPVPVPGPTSAAAPIATDLAVVSATFDASTLATGDAYQRAVQNLIEMGFPAEQVARAMKAAYNNPDRAAEYLMTGIPENIESMAAPESRSTAPTSAALATAAATGEIPAPPIEGGYVNLFEAGAAAARDTAANTTNTTSDLDRIAALASTPEFQQFRQLIQAQPQLLQPMLQQLGQSQPELLRVIQQNPDAFLQILGAGSANADAFGDYDDDDEDGQMAGGLDGAQTIQITAEENAAIERLTALGFDRNVAAQAYFACDKNEELAANYLFENGGDW